MLQRIKLLAEWLLDRTLLPLIEAFSPPGEHAKEDEK